MFSLCIIFAIFCSKFVLVETFSGFGVFNRSFAEESKQTVPYQICDYFVCTKYREYEVSVF